MFSVIGNIHLSNAELGWGYQLRALVSSPLFSLTSMSIAHRGSWMPNRVEETRNETLWFALAFRPPQPETQKRREFQRRNSRLFEELLLSVSRFIFFLSCSSQLFRDPAILPAVRRGSVWGGFDERSGSQGNESHLTPNPLLRGPAHPRLPPLKPGKRRGLGEAQRSKCQPH